MLETIQCAIAKHKRLCRIQRETLQFDIDLLTGVASKHLKITHNCVCVCVFLEPSLSKASVFKSPIFSKYSTVKCYYLLSSWGRKCEIIASRATPSLTTQCLMPVPNVAAWRKPVCCWKICERPALSLTSSPTPPS